MVFTEQEEQVLKLMIEEKIAELKVAKARAAERVKLAAFQEAYAAKHQALINYDVKK